MTIDDTQSYLVNITETKVTYTILHKLHVCTGTNSHTLQTMV